MTRPYHFQCHQNTILAPRRFQGLVLESLQEQLLNALTPVRIETYSGVDSQLTPVTQLPCRTRTRQGVIEEVFVEVRARALGQFPEYAQFDIIDAVVRMPQRHEQTAG